MRRREFIEKTGAVVAATCGLIPCSNAAANRPNTMPEYATTGVELLDDSNPATDGFHFPAEWESHAYTIMALPPPQNWKGYGIPMEDVRRQWANVANQLSDYEPVLMVVRPADRASAARLLSREIELIQMPLNDGWSRDTGPMFLTDRNGNLRVAGFTFNGWGRKFPPYSDDALLKARIAAARNVSMYPIDLVLEGGAITCDGEGTVITTKQCLLNANRNPGKERVVVERVLNNSLGTRKVIWLDKGLHPDPITDGHVDGIAAFAAPGVVLLHTTRDRGDRNYDICRRAKRTLQRTLDANGRKLEIVEMPLDGELSHMNFYIANECVLVPVTGHRRDNERPLAILREVFSERKVVQTDGTILNHGGGGIHCITQQVPG